jgi:hypothetical protein
MADLQTLLHMGNMVTFPCTPTSQAFMHDTPTPTFGPACSSIFLQYIPLLILNVQCHIHPRPFMFTSQISLPFSYF